MTQEEQEKALEQFVAELSSGMADADQISHDVIDKLFSDMADKNADCQMLIFPEDEEPELNWLEMERMRMDFPIFSTGD